MTYSLIRTRDGAGDSGPMSRLIRYNDKKEFEEKNGRPELGWAMQVGSPYTRTYQIQDYWQTTYIQEILEDTPNKVKFKTNNSEYVWEEF